MKRLAVILVLLLATVSSAPAAPSAAPPRATAQEVRRLMEVTGVASQMKQLQQYFAKSVVEGIHKSHPDLPPAALQEVQEDVEDVMSKHVEGPDGLMARGMEVYQRHFTPEDVAGLIRFYQSPLGKRWVEERPLLMKDLLASSQQWGESLGPELEARLRKTLSKYGAPKP